MKVEIPESVKEVLRCGECDELLSCGPVFLLHGTSAAICGRCSQQSSQEKEEEASASTSGNRDWTRNIQYEAAAKLLLFPCRYSSQGCLEKFDFSAEQPNLHERDCKFRKIFCPIESREFCGWIGSCQNLTDHCRDVHPTIFFQNPLVFPRPDLSKSNLSNFLVSAFNFLFLVHIKVCLTSEKLFHSVQMFGNSKLLDKFSYSLEISENDAKIVKKGSVLRPETMMLEGPTADYICINRLLDLFCGKYNESEFTITIQSSLTENCLNCMKKIKNAFESEFCEECQGKLDKCKFSDKACLFVDVNKDKCRKHENMFCKYQTKCYTCEVNFVGGSWIEHLSSSTSCRKTTNAKMNSNVRVTRNTSSDCDVILFSSNYIGTIIFSCYLSHSNFKAWLFTSLPSHELKNFKCSIELTDPLTEESQILAPQILYDSSWDWSIDAVTKDFVSRENNIGIDVKMNIEKL